MFFRRVLKKGAFSNAKTFAAFDPASGPASPADARARVDAALAKFNDACRARTAAGQEVLSTVFGTISVEDYAKYQELHTRHHTAQIPQA